MTRFCIVILILWSTGCTSSSPATYSNKPDGHDHAHAHEHKRFTQPEQYTAQWNTPTRDVWQKPGEIVQALTLKPGQTVADLGAGTGYLLPHLSGAVGEQGKVWAVDMEPAMVGYLRQAVVKEGWSNVSVQKSTASAIGLGADSLDAVVTLNTWHHIEDRVAYLGTLAPLIRKGGHLVVVDFEPGTGGKGPPESMRLASSAVLQEFVKAGWSAEIVEESMPRHYIVRGRPAAR